MVVAAIPSSPATRSFKTPVKERQQKEIVRKKKLARDVQTAREKLTSVTGLERSFEAELLRLFAQYRVGAGIPMLVLIGAIAATSSLWMPSQHLLVWLTLVLTALCVQTALASHFLKQTLAPENIALWRRIFVLADGVQGAAWALILHMLLITEFDAARMFVVFLVLILSAVIAMLSATVPMAVYVSLIPLTGSMVWFFLPIQEVDKMMFMAMAMGGQIFFLFLSNRLYSSTVIALESRAEKDAMLIELEQAKSNSDEARRRAEEANLAKSRFLATMSHELRTPLNAILGFSEVMKNEVFGGHSSASYKEYSGDIHSSGQHLLNLINEILDLSRIEAGRYELTEESIPLADIVDECRHMLNLRARNKNQTLTASIDKTLPRLWADERAVRQVILNLLSNAIKFTPANGDIKIQVGWTSSGGQYVSIKDSGPGIPEEEIPVVMASFGRGSLALKTAEQGSGLGLPIVKGLVDLHGGNFQLISKVREGTEVRVTFPSARVMNALPPMSVKTVAPASAASPESDRSKQPLLPSPERFSGDLAAQASTQTALSRLYKKKNAA
jgi:two-component system, cell cycle sensor histidine kinase PleC